MTDRYRQQTMDSQCFTKAKERNQLTFTLVEQDILAVGVIGEWIKQGIILGVPREKLHDALDDACNMRDSGVVKKVPD